MGSERRMRQMTREEALGKLASVPFGRVAFSWRALPAIRPVNHVVCDDQVIIPADGGAAIVAEAGNGTSETTVVAYEADQIDPSSGTGWFVVVVGRAALVRDPQEAARYRQALPTWTGADATDVISLVPEIVSGYEMTAER
jgi:nitroimidazol reductase NimA-like FMN-containing flavoprotein (pyridoxamine 5'-phosphate oxidase superfamily)